MPLLLVSAVSLPALASYNTRNMPMHQRPVYRTMMPRKPRYQNPPPRREARYDYAYNTDDGYYNSGNGNYYDSYGSSGSYSNDPYYDDRSNNESGWCDNNDYACLDSYQNDEGYYHDEYYSYDQNDRYDYGGGYEYDYVQQSGMCYSGNDCDGHQMPPQHRSPPRQYPRPVPYHDACYPIVCQNGAQYPSCSEDGHPINYFADPCSVSYTTSCGNGWCEAGETAESYASGYCPEDCGAY